MSVEGTRSYGIGLARAATAAGLLVLEAEQPPRKTRRGGQDRPHRRPPRRQSALRLPLDRLPTPRADGDREALRTCSAPATTSPLASTAQINRLRALLRDTHDDTDRQLALVPALTDATLTRLARRRLSGDASREQAIRHEMSA